MIKRIVIDGRTIGQNSAIFLIAEAGVNHNGDLTIAKQLIDVAANSNVDAIKFQTFITENVLLIDTPKVKYQKESKNDNQTLYEMVKNYEFNKEDFRVLKEYCNEKGIIFLSTPYDETSLDWLEDLNISAYKIGSGDMNNYYLLKLICSKKKPILLSTGMATLEEVKETIEFLNKNMAKDIVLFQCTTNYPSDFETLNLNVIDTYRKEFPDLILGFSDHSLGISASIGAAAKGVKMIEKHITIDKDLPGPDHKASLDPAELKNWVDEIRNIEKALGSYKKKPSKIEIETAKSARRSIVSLRELKKGQQIREEDITTKRPGTGIPASYYFKILGKKIINDVVIDSIITWEDIE